MKKFARLKRPVYVTETGIANKSDRLRGEWAESYFRAVSIENSEMCTCMQPHISLCITPAAALAQGICSIVCKLQGCMLTSLEGRQQINSSWFVRR